MKIFLFVFLLGSATLTVAQPTIIKQAIVSTTTTVIAPEEEEVQNLQNQGGGGGMNFRNMMDGETSFTTYLKNDMVKTVIKSEMGRSTIYRDNSKMMTTMLIEMMGNKMGFYATDEEQAAMQKRRDSMQQARRKADTTQQSAGVPIENTIDISYTDETKKIAGYTCKKAYVITTRLLTIKDTAVVWFTPEIKLQNVLSTGGLAGMGNMGMSLGGLDKIDGFVMRYEMNKRRNRRMEVEVKKIDLKKEIDDKEFTVPKDIELKPMREMQNMFGGGQGGFQRGRN